jgi:hypothetical protein
MALARRAPAQAAAASGRNDDADPVPKHAGSYRARAEVLKRTFDIDVLDCANCRGRMKLLGMITDAKGVQRFLAKLGEPTEVPGAPPAAGLRIGRAGCRASRRWPVTDSCTRERVQTEPRR